MKSFSVKKIETPNVNKGVSVKCHMDGLVSSKTVNLVLTTVADITSEEHNSLLIN